MTRIWLLPRRYVLLMLEWLWGQVRLRAEPLSSSLKCVYNKSRQFQWNTNKYVFSTKISTDWGAVSDWSQVKGLSHRSVLKLTAILSIHRDIRSKGQIPRSNSFFSPRISLLVRFAFSINKALPENRKKLRFCVQLLLTNKVLYVRTEDSLTTPHVNIELCNISIKG